MPRTTDIVRSSIITAFTIAAALIWKDVIVDFIAVIVPAGEELFFKFIAAIVATVLVVIAIYLTLKAESETEFVIKKAELFVERLTHKEPTINSQAASIEKKQAPTPPKKQS